MTLFFALVFAAALQAPATPAAEPGPAVGEKVPPFRAADQTGRLRSFADLRGPKGLVLLFFRSAAWLTYSKNPQVDLEQQVESFRRQGLGVAAISYDAPEVLRDFAQRRHVTFPLLSDHGSKVIRAFGLENPEYPPGDRAHGVPYPGTLVIDAAGVVRSRSFEKAYTERRTAGSILLDLEGAPAAGSPSGGIHSRSEGGGSGGRGHSAPQLNEDLRTEHFAVLARASNADAAPGQRVTLALDFAMTAGRHAYAPGRHSYRPLLFRLDANPLVKLHDTVYPPPQPYFFAPLKETVPVFEGRFRLTRDVTLATGKEIAALAASDDPTLALTGAIDYQVCSDTLCYPPRSLPVRFKLRVRPLDRERAPEALRSRERTSR